jgi:endonuclease YncB( thermonuclease family)
MARRVHAARAVASALALIAIALAPACAVARPVATVVSVGDGDTIRVKKDDELITVRLACIDAPEMAQRPYGPKARRYLQQRLPVGSSVRLAEKTTDRYGRMVAEVFNDININLLLVEDGQAFVYGQYLKDCDAKEYLAAEERAKRRRYGMWQGQGGIARPWDFRRKPHLKAGQQGSNERVSWSYPSNPIAWVAQSQHLLRNSPDGLDPEGKPIGCERTHRHATGARHCKLAARVQDPRQVG